MTTAEILAKAADLIEPEGAWTQGRLATSEPTDLYELDPRSPYAHCFCAVGALCHVTNARNWSELPTAIDQIAVEIAARAGFTSLSDWNDALGRTQAEVVRALRDAAKAAS